MEEYTLFFNSFFLTQHQFFALYQSFMSNLVTLQQLQEQFYPVQDSCYDSAYNVTINLA